MSPIELSWTDKKGIERLRGMNNSGVGGWRAIISQLLQRRLSDSWPSLGYLSFLKDLSISNRHVQSAKVYHKDKHIMNRSGFKSTLFASFCG